MELNREQIIKGLEAFSGCGFGEDCLGNQCPYFDRNCGDMIEDALSLIKELTEENERLRADKGYEQGVKDFAERVKNYYRHTTSRPLPATVEYYIDQIEKEMLDEV